MPINFENIFNKFIKNPKWVFIIVVIIVCALQFLLLNILLTFGLSYEEWLLLFKYKLIGSEGLIATFNANGIYSTTYIYYIGILESIFKGNYQAYQVTNIILKTLATISLYPLVVVIFKRKLLAFLATTFYAISYSSSGALQFVVKGTDYLAIFFMNICLASYYLSFKTKRRFMLHITTALLFLSFIFSPIRIYPLLLFIILVEVVVWVKFRQWIVLLFRLLLLFLPFLILLQLGPGSTSNYLTTPNTVFKFISLGNYQLLLTPFAGLGYTFLPNDYLSIFGKATFDNFKDYLSFLFHGPIIIYSSLSILLGFLLTRKPLKYFLAVMFTNVVFEIVSYFFITNLKGVTGPNVKGFHLISTNAIFLGFFVISAAISALIVWLNNHRSNTLLVSLFIGPIFSSVFLWGTWLIIGDNLTFKEGIHWYLIIPPIGSSLFLASLMVMGFDRIKRITNLYFKYALITCLFLVLAPIYSISSKEINTTFGNLLQIGYGAKDQEEIKAKLLSKMNSPFDTNPALFYFDASEDSNTPQMFYPTVLGLIAGFNEKMHFRNWEIINGCTALVYDKEILKKSIVVQNGVRGFVVSSLCITDYYATGFKQIFYKQSNLHAFKLKNKEFIDIKEEVMEKLGFN